MNQQDKVYFGELYYPSGALQYRGCLREEAQESGGFIGPFAYGEGTEFFEDGTVSKQGYFQRAGLLYGKVYYPSGKLKFVGIYNYKEFEVENDYTLSGDNHDYYGPSYPLYGRFYAEDGKMLHHGKFTVHFSGSVGYPYVVHPKEFGNLT